MVTTTLGYKLPNSKSSPLFICNPVSQSCATQAGTRSHKTQCMLQLFLPCTHTPLRTIQLSLPFTHTPLQTTSQTSPPHSRLIPNDSPICSLFIHHITLPSTFLLLHVHLPTWLPSPLSWTLDSSMFTLLPPLSCTILRPVPIVAGLSQAFSCI